MNKVAPKDCTINSHHDSAWAGTLNDCGKILTCPMSDFFLVQMSKTVRALEPGTKDQGATTCEEIIIRCARVALCLISLLPILAFGIVGGIMRTLASLDRRKFILIQPKDGSQPEQVQSLKICTFNASIMPSFINLFFRSFSPAKERVKSAVDAAKSCGADVLCLQEAFNTDVVDEFVSQIRERYPYIIWNAGFSSFGLSSGLLIASRFPIENPQFWEHREKLGTEHCGSKGMMAVTIKPKPNQEIVIFNTHLEAGVDYYKKPEIAQACRVNQLKDVQRNANTYRGSRPHAFLCGDMNISPYLPTNDLTQLKTLIDVDDKAQGTLYQHLPAVHQATNDCACMQNNNINHHYAIDMIAPLKPTQIQAPIKTSRHCFNGASDHVAFIAEFNLPQLAVH